MQDSLAHSALLLLVRFLSVIQDLLRISCKMPRLEETRINVRKLHVLLQIFRNDIPAILQS
jgi:hypothetical protein